MSVTTNAAAYECDAPECDEHHIVSARFPGEYQPPPEGWLLLSGDDAALAPFAFCSFDCLHYWAEGMVSA